MKKADVQVGRHYKAKVSGSEVPVLITGELPGSGWEAKNIKTGKPIRIKSAQRLRAALRHLDEGSQAGKKRSPEEIAAAKQSQAAVEAAITGKRVMTKAEYEAQADSPTGDVGGSAAKSAGAAGKYKARPQCAKGERGATPAKRPSGLDAAVAVLAEAGKPMNATEMVERMLATGLWKTGGRTPASTIYAAVIREIAAKGNRSRFRKVERGKFELTK